MVICVIALVVFSVLGIFSARYRGLSAEAFDCVFRKVTLRSCATDLNQRIRARVVAKVFIRSPKMAGLIRRHFETLSWIFVILTIGSALLSAQAGYNLWKYGACTPSDPGACVFAPTTGHDVTSCGSEHCAIEGCSCDNTTVGGCTSRPSSGAAPDFKACAGNCTCKTGTCG